MIRPAKLNLYLSQSKKQRLKSKPQFSWKKALQQQAQEEKRSEREEEGTPISGVWRDRMARVSFIEALYVFPTVLSLCTWMEKRIVTISVHVGDETLAHTYCEVDAKLMQNCGRPQIQIWW